MILLIIYHISAVAMNFNFKKTGNSNLTQTFNSNLPKPNLVQYNTPVTKDMAILFVYFNPCKYRRIIQNVLTVKHQMDCAQIPYFIGEIKHDSDSNYLFCKSDNVFQYSSNSYMFYKENLIRVVEPLIPSCFTKICIMDFDMLFDNPDWYSVVSEKLNSVKIVQPFKTANYLNIDYSIFESRTNCVDKKTFDPINYFFEQSGFIWAFDREWFSSYFFDDMTITGMGDTVFANNITRRSYNDAGSFYVNFSSYIKPSTVNVPYGSCDLIVHHLNHGPLINRQYNNINQIFNSTFAQNGFKKIDDVLCRRDDGILEYKPEYLNLFNHIMLTYFKIRNDDFAYFTA
jgi:hypothetical protein